MAGSVDFRVTDGKTDIVVVFDGALPDLFREGQGVVAEGRLRADGVFVATSVLAKHDEKYMPPEVADALKKAGRWQEGGKRSPGRPARLSRRRVPNRAGLSLHGRRAATRQYGRRWPPRSGSPHSGRDCVRFRVLAMTAKLQGSGAPKSSARRPRPPFREKRDEGRARRIPGSLDPLAAHGKDLMLHLAAAEAPIEEPSGIVAQHPDDRRAAFLIRRAARTGRAGACGRSPGSASRAGRGGVSPRRRGRDRGGDRRPTETENVAVVVDGNRTSQRFALTMTVAHHSSRRCPARDSTKSVARMPA